MSKLYCGLPSPFKQKYKSFLEAIIMNVESQLHQLILKTILCKYTLCCQVLHLQISFQNSNFLVIKYLLEWTIWNYNFYRSKTIQFYSPAISVVCIYISILLIILFYFSYYFYVHLMLANGLLIKIWLLETFKL